MSDFFLVVVNGVFFVEESSGPTEREERKGPIEKNGSLTWTCHIIYLHTDHKG